MKIKTLAIAVAFASACTQVVRADGGMWLPTEIAANIDTMHALGCQLTPDDIYSNYTKSLKDAIVDFDGGCSGSFISADGLVLTNYHCGYDRIQQLSTIEHDYLTDGYWATCRNDELPCPGATVRVLVRMADVTDLVLDGVTETLTYDERNDLIERNINNVIEAAETDPTFEPEVEATYNGNKYYIYIYRTYNDVRLVGAPPSSIGKFGGDTDNWMWPRHTGDFSIFRVYADADNLPSAFSETNQPYKPRKHLTISLDGVNEGDFTLVYGLPGSTTLYEPATYANMLLNFMYPRLVELRTAKIDAMNRFEQSSAEARLHYAAKHASTSNSWKRMQGEIAGMKSKHIIERKLETEAKLLTDSTAADILKQYETIYGSIGSDVMTPYTAQRVAKALIKEVIYWEAMEICEVARLIYNVLRNEPLDDYDIIDLQLTLEEFYDDYISEVDRAVSAASLVVFVKYMPDELLPKSLSKHRNDIQTFVDNLFNSSILDDPDKTLKLFEAKPEEIIKTLKADPAYKFYLEMRDIQDNKVSSYYADNKDLTPRSELARQLTAVQLQHADGQLLPPDATSTLRVSYGQVQSCTPRDAVHYNYFSTLEGVIAKCDTTIYDYNVPPRLRELRQSADYGPYADSDSSLHVCFIATNHTTGGNSGSAVLNAHGQLIGINFDRMWEGCMSDIMFDDDICRNIMVDIRYVLFIIDKFANSQYIMQELDIARNSTKE